MKIKKEDYCVLYNESKGYYLSKMEIARSLSLTPIEIGTKRDCEDFISDNNSSSRLNSEEIIQLISGL